MTRPLFLMLTYRQERYMAESVAAALAQEGPPLDILISDDASPDGTFAAIERAVADYDGPHRVQLNRNAENLGFVGHLNACVAMTDNAVIVYAAGDDISFPDRARRQVAEFEDPGVRLVHSRFDPIDGEGRSVAGAGHDIIFGRTTDPRAVAVSQKLYVGATGAWHRALFDRYGPLPEGTFEDLILGFRAALEGGVRMVDAELVGYRWNVGLSARAETSTAESWQAARVAAMTRSALVFAAREKDAALAGWHRFSRLRWILRRRRDDAEGRLAVLNQSLEAFLADPAPGRAGRLHREEQAALARALGGAAPGGRRV